MTTRKLSGGEISYSDTYLLEVSVYKDFPLIAMIALATVTLACGVQINIPVKNINTIEPVKEKIHVDKPESSTEVTHLTFNFGLGKLNLSPGADNALVDGSAIYNIEDFKPQIHIDGSQVTIETGDLEIDGIPKFDKKQKNEWNLKLGDMPLAININAGAYQGNLEFGGLSISSLHIVDGASDVKVRFSEPNQIEMSEFKYETGASEVELYGLANANFSKMSFKSGAGGYTLDFSGELLQDADVTINSGMSTLTIVVPKGTSARVFFDSGLANADVHGEWKMKDNGYYLAGGDSMLTININMAAGNLILNN